MHIPFDIICQPVIVTTDTSTWVQNSLAGLHCFLKKSPLKKKLHIDVMELRVVKYDLVDLIQNTLQVATENTTVMFCLN